MLKRKIAELSARWFRATVARIATDLELVGTIQASSTSASLVSLLMYNAKICTSRLDVMSTAYDASMAEGFVCELGVYKGQSLNEIASHFSPAKVYGFDTFTGLPDFWRDGFPEGAFAVSKESLRFEANCVLYQGLFDDTLPKFLQEVQSNARLIHVDCDLYSSTRSALTVLAPRIRPGTVLVFDEYFNYPGWQEHEHRAFREFLDETRYGCKYIAYNKFGQQVAVLVTDSQDLSRHRS